MMVKRKILEFRNTDIYISLYLDFVILEYLKVLMGRIGNYTIFIVILKCWDIEILIY